MICVAKVRQAFVFKILCSTLNKFFFGYAIRDVRVRDITCKVTGGHVFLVFQPSRVVHLLLLNFFTFQVADTV